ncbi:EF-hand protein [Obba rivulosa]|uniref:EF-hand protein n=1 Tax=Obba rivulosa TaxID=1052685 RepID=A0A8E2DT30_9APHY|nr:EF-hand protein [Obba rivulosa]
MPSHPNLSRRGGPQHPCRESSHPVEHGRYRPPPGPPPSHSAPSPSQAPVISVEDDVKRLFNVCTIGRGHASLLQDSLVFVKPEDIKEELIQEFLTRCRASQEVIISQIPWATTQAERSRSAAHSSAATTEEQLLEELLSVNGALTDALKLYDDLERVVNENEAEDRLKTERLIEALTAVAEYSPTAEEAGLIDLVFAVGDVRNNGQLSTGAAAKIFGGANLSSSTLSKVLDIANIDQKDELDRQSVGVALRLIGHAQKGATVTERLVKEPGPLAVLPGLSSQQETGGLPPLTPQDKAKFYKLFLNSGANDGVLDGFQARAVLLKSRLPEQILSRVWDFADVNRRGFLDLGEFTVAMYLIQALMGGRITSLPQSLPDSVYDLAGVRRNASGISHLSGEQITSTSSLAASSSTLSQHGPSSSAREWDIPPSLKAQSDKIFDTLDPQRSGRLVGDVTVPFLLKTGLPLDVLKRIWDLADISRKGYLSRDDFAVALYLVGLKKQGKELPSTLPASLIPPSERDVVAPKTIAPPNEHILDAPLIDLNEMPSLHTPPSTSLGHPASPGTLSRRLSRISTASPSPLPLQPTGGISPTFTFRSPVASPPATSSPPNRSSSSPQIARRISGASEDWVITPAEKTHSDKFFDTLDPFRKGFIEGDSAVAFFAKSKLPDNIMAAIWDLADRNHDGALTRDEFAIAMHLVRKKLQGRELPVTLPPSLVIVPPTQPEITTSDAPAPATELEEVERIATPPPPYESVPLEG